MTTNGRVHEVTPRVDRSWVQGATLVAEIPVEWIDDRETAWVPTEGACVLADGPTIDEVVIEAFAGTEWLGEFSLETTDRADADLEVCGETQPITAWAGPNMPVPLGCYCMSTLDTIFCMRFAPLTGWYTYCTNCCN